MKPYLDDGDVRLLLGDCVQVMAGLESESVDAVVTDPPYGLEFMGKEWDRLAETPGYNERGRITERPDSQVPYGRGGGVNSYQAGKPMQDWHQAWATQALRVLRPGGHLVAFGGTRTFHRLTCAIEDAGFEIRDCLSWLYGSGFPKSLDVGKAIDKAAGAEREVVGKSPWAGRESVNDLGRMNDDAWEPTGEPRAITAPATPEAAAWQGWGTALKPAWEPIVLARKPLAGTVAANVLAHGVGVLNVDGCRVEGAAGDGHWRSAGGSGLYEGAWQDTGLEGQQNPAGRWPANVVLDEEAAALLDEEVGERTSNSGKPFNRNSNESSSTYGTYEGVPAAGYYGDTGGPSRFFKTVALTEEDEHAGALAGASGAPAGLVAGPGVEAQGMSRAFYTAKASSAERDGASHPTVKPLALMRWLVRLVTPPGGLVLDCFAGSGTTGLACREEGMRALLIEREREYCEMAAHRLRQLSLFSG